MIAPSAMEPLVSLLRPVRGRLLLAMSLQLVASALVLSPLITGSIIAARFVDDPSDPGIWSTLVHGTLLFSAGLALKGVADLVAHLADNSLTLVLRRRVAQRLRRAPLAWFTDTTAGRVKQGMQDDVTALHHLVAHSLNELAGAVVTPIVAYGYLFLVDWRLASILVAPVPAFAVVYGRMLASSSAHMDRYGAALADINGAVVEFVDGIPVVKTFGRTGRASAAYRAAVDRFTTFFISWTRPLVAPEIASHQVVAPVSLLTLALTFGVTFVHLGWMDPVDVVPFALVGLSVGGPIATLTSGVLALQLGRAAAGRLSDLLDTPQVAEPTHPRSPAGRRIDVEGVTFGYHAGQPVLQGLTASFEPGTVTAVVGPSGAGKTTLARMLLRYADPCAGQVRLGGVPLDEIAPAELFRIVGSVFQDARLLRTSVARNIALARPDVPREEVERAARAANIHDRIARLPRGYDTVVGEGAGFSGGEAQRICIARALVLDPDILVLDEPTSAADAESQHAIQAALSALVDGGRTVVVIAHRLATIRAADQILVMDSGRVVERGRHDELMALGGTYRRLWDTQHTTEG